MPVEPDLRRPAVPRAKPRGPVRVAMGAALPIRPPGTAGANTGAERQNLTTLMQMRRFTRLTNAFSKKVTNLEHAVALHFMHYNFCRIHQSLRVTAAMEAGISDHVWSLEEMIDLLG